jgi:hypothetical protein
MNIILLQKIKVVFYFQIIGVVFYLKKMNILFHFQKTLSWVKIRLHAENQLAMLPRTARIVMSPGDGVMVWWWFILTDKNTTPTKVVLSCFGLLVGLWQ